MKIFTKTAFLSATLAMGLALGACDSQKENAEEAAAQDVREASEAAADAMETQAADMRDGAEAKADKMEDKADAVREQGDAKADKIEDNADKRDAAPE